MKRIWIMVLAIVLVSGMVSAQSISKDKDVKTLSIPNDGRAKVGLLLGYPSGATFGYRMSNWFEFNVNAGYDFIGTNSPIVGGNALFTLVNIPIGDAGVLPLSIGPQVTFVLGKDFYIDTVADIRLEYTFADIPLNLFIESGFGFRIFNDGDWWAYNGGIGVRYVF